MMISIRYADDPKIRKAQKFALWTVAGLAGAVVFGFLFGFLIQFLWNATLAEIFGFPALSFWQAIGLFVLAKLFFGFGSGGGGSAQRNKTSKRKIPEKRELETQPESEPAVPADDESFRKYWREEGKASYEAFRQKPDEEPEQV